MLVNIVSQTHMLARFAIDSNMLANILDFERHLNVFFRISNKFNYKNKKKHFKSKWLTVRTDLAPPNLESFAGKMKILKG